MRFLSKLLLGMCVMCLFPFSIGFAQVADLEQDSIFKEDDTIEEIRDKIDQMGYEFTVDHNWVFDMPEEQKKEFLSRRRPVAETLENLDMGPLAHALGRTLPTSFDWRSYNGHSYIGPVRQQGSCGSCYSFGANAAAEGTYNFAMGKYDGQCIDLSESYIIWCLGRLSQYNSHFFGCGGADYSYSELTALCTEGTTYESYFPYQENDPGSCTHNSDPRLVWQSWHRVPCNDIEAIKTAIMTYGVVDAAVYVDSAFQGYSGGIFENSSTTCTSSPCYDTPTNHAISLVGWNDNGGNGYWILRNSWGSTSWGESGYMRIKYTSARVACEVCYLVYQTPANTPTPSGPTPTRTPTQPAAQILVVDDDNNAAYESYYTAALTANGKTYDVVTGSPSAAQLSGRQMVIWFCGDDYSTTLTATDQTNLTTYLNAGGNLFMSGQDIGYDIQGDGTFMTNYLHAGFVKDDTNNYAMTGAGIMAGTNVTIEGTGGAANQGYPSAISVQNGGTAIFTYGSGDGPGGVSYSGAYKTVYLSFGFEAINSAASRTAVMGKVISFFTGTTPPTSTPVPPTSTPIPPTSTVAPATNTPTRTPTRTPTNTPAAPTSTPVPPTSTPVVTGKVLLVDDDEGGTLETYYTAALTANGKAYDIVTTSPSVATMNNYTAVIWFTGADYDSTLSASDQTNLTTYLNGGGRLFLTGQDIGYDIRSDSGNFYGNYLKASYLKDDTDNYTMTGAGFLASLNVTISGTGGANNQTYPSGMNNNGGTVCYTYGGTGNGAGGICYSGAYKTVYFSFGFEAINDATARKNVMNAVLNYLGGTAGPTNTPAPPTATPTRTPTPVPTGSKTVLIVDDDKAKTYESYYTAAIPAGYTYTVFTVSTDGPTAAQMAGYSAVVWFCGDDYTTTLTANDITNLTTYLNGGGKLFITGQDIGYQLRTNAFYGNYLRASYVSDDTNITALTGVSGGVMGGISVTISGTGGANNQNYPSSITAANGSTSIFTYTGGAIGGVSYSGTYKLVYLSFGFEGINAAATRSSVMNAALNFLTN